MSIRGKFLLLLTLILVVGVGTTGGVLIVQGARHDQALIAEKQRLLVEHAAFALQENLSVAARELSRIAKLPEMDPADSDTDPERQLLYGAHENSVFFKTIRLLDAAGHVTLVQPAGSEPPGGNFGDRRWFDAARRTHQPFFYTVPERSPLPEAIGLVVPLHRDAGFLGAIQGVLDLHGDRTVTSELAHTAGPSGEVEIVDRDSHVLFPPGESHLDSKGWSPALRGLLSGHSGSVRVREGSTDYLFAWAPVSIGGGWSVMMRWPWSALSGGVREQLISTVAILAVGVLLVALVSLLFAARLTRPLLELAEVAARLARGEPGGVAPSPRRDEVGALANAFHHMEGELAQQGARIREDLETISRLNTSLEERVRDRTAALEAAQARLVEVERFAAMGKTSAAIAHEVRNALNGLGMCVDLVLADTKATAASRRVRAQIHHELARLRDITESLLTFSRTPRLDFAPTDVRALVERALSVCSEQIADGGVTVQRRPDDGAPLFANCDAYKLQGVIINLVKNAVEAMTTRKLDLAAESTEPLPRDRVLTVAVEQRGEHAVITIADTGPGLLPEARSHLFEPFFTTKVTGTGLGLATARRIVEAHGGTLNLRDAAPEGIIAEIEVPCRLEERAAASSAS